MPNIKLIAATFLVLSGPAMAQDWTGETERAGALVADGDYDNAIEPALQAVRLAPDRARRAMSAANLGNLMFRRGELDMAARLYEYALSAEHEPGALGLGVRANLALIRGLGATDPSTRSRLGKIEAAARQELGEAHDLTALITANVEALALARGEATGRFTVPASGPARQMALNNRGLFEIARARFSDAAVSQREAMASDDGDASVSFIALIGGEAGFTEPVDCRMFGGGTGPFNPDPSTGGDLAQCGPFGTRPVIGGWNDWLDDLPDLPDPPDGGRGGGAGAGNGDGDDLGDDIPDPEPPEDCSECLDLHLDLILECAIHVAPLGRSGGSPVPITLPDPGQQGEAPDAGEVTLDDGLSTLFASITIKPKPSWLPAPPTLFDKCNAIADKLFRDCQQSVTGGGQCDYAEPPEEDFP